MLTLTLTRTLTLTQPLVRSLLFGQVGVPAQLYQRLRKPEWAGVGDRFDDRVDGDDDVAFILRSYLVGMINRLTRFKRDDVYATVCDFARESRRDLQYQ